MVRLVVMAAGLASRMGKDKLALPWGDSTILGYVIHTAVRAGQLLGPDCPRTELVVVARQPMEAYVTESLQTDFQLLGGTWLRLPAYRPLAEIIKAGLCGVTGKTLGVGFLPGDQVGIGPATLHDLLASFMAHRPDFLVPVAGQITGSPVLFHRKYFPELLKLQGEQGGKQVVKRFKERWSTFPVDPGFFCDVDTPADYSVLRSNIIR